VVGISEKDWDRLAQEKLDAEAKRQAEEDEQHALGILPLNDRLPEHDDYTGVVYRMKWRYRGGRHYELSNHLGNVQVVVTDKKIAHSSGGVDWAYYTADVYTASDYGAFGMEIEERGFERAPEKGYRYGMNGQEKDDDVASGVFSAQYWEYDSRIGRRWNLEPLEQKFPFISPYAVDNCNPILYGDSDGKSAIAGIDKESKTITVASTFMFYGGGSTPALAKTYAENVEKAFNKANGKVMIDGVEYKVQFKIFAVDLTSIVGSDLKANKTVSGIMDMPEFKNNTALNWIRLENKTDSKFEGCSYTDKAGANSGYWSTKQITENKGTTEPHEFNHGLGGLGHPEEIYGVTGGNQDQSPSIDMTSNSTWFVKENYLIRSKEGVSVDVSKRKVTQANISAIFTEDVKKQLKETGKANIGTVTNEFHEKEKKK
jgi:hypothetical protein